MIGSAARRAVIPDAGRIELTEDDIISFIDMWQRAFGETLSRDVAMSEAGRLIDFFLTLADERRQAPEPFNPDFDPIPRCDTLAP